MNCNYENITAKIIKMVEIIEWKSRDISILKQIDSKNEMIEQYQKDIKNIKEDIKKLIISFLD